MRKINLILIPAIFTAVFFSYAQDIQLPMRKDSVKFAVIGDNGTGDKSEYQIADKLAAAHQKFPFEFVVMMGDNLYGNEAVKDFVNKFEKPYKALLDAGVKFYATLGNHDDPARQITYEEWKNRPLLEKLNEATAAMLKWEL